jgi:hypothetical protein
MPPGETALIFSSKTCFGEILFTRKVSEFFSTEVLTCGDKRLTRGAISKACI